MKDFVLEQRKLNNIEVSIPEPSSNIKPDEVKQYMLDSLQVAFAKHLPKFRKAFAIGQKFAKDITDVNKSNS